MKTGRILFIVIAGLLVFGPSCTKTKDISSAIMGKWNIKSDSSYKDVGSGNHEVIYIGQSGDYFNFNADGHVYISEHSILDTLIYSLKSDSTIVQNFSFADGRSKAPSTSTQNLIITSRYFYTPGGAFGRTVYLTR